MVTQPAEPVEVRAQHKKTENSLLLLLIIALDTVIQRWKYCSNCVQLNYKLFNGSLNDKYNNKDAPKTIDSKSLVSYLKEDRWWQQWGRDTEV